MNSKNLKELLVAEEKSVDEAVREAGRYALLTHKRAGAPIASWKDDEVVIIPADKIVVEDEDGRKRE